MPTSNERCVAWGCKNKMTRNIPEPRWQEAYEAGRGVPWLSICDLPVVQSRSGLTYVHPKKA